MEYKSKLRNADAILIATPEYNYSPPGVLKNALDFASRSYGDNPFDGKPVAIRSTRSTSIVCWVVPEPSIIYVRCLCFWIGIQSTDQK